MYSIDYRRVTSENAFTFGNSALGSEHDLDVKILAGARVDVQGMINYDNAS